MSSTFSSSRSARYSRAVSLCSFKGSTRVSSSESMSSTRGEVLPRVLHAALGVQFAGLVLDDARRFLEHLAPVLRAHREYIVDTALADEGIALLADARIAEKIHDVAQAAGGRR